MLCLILCCLIPLLGTVALVYYAYSQIVDEIFVNTSATILEILGKLI
jgi:hypothetical protein